MAVGLICTTTQRTAAARWLPAIGPTPPPDGYTEQLAGATGPFVERFAAFDEELTRHHLADVFNHHLAILADAPDGQQGQGWRRSCSRAIAPSSGRRAGGAARSESRPWS